jgi:hypothetical protein
MKIKWIGDKRLVPRIGILQHGDVRQLPDDTARGFIKQGLAEKFVIKENKKSKTKE